MNSQGDMKISAMHSHLNGVWEPVHQSVNSRNKSDVSARDKFLSADFDGMVEEHE
jgi:hypothetical protein